MLVTPLATVRRAASRAREASETRLAALRDGVEEAVDYLTGSYDNSDDEHHDQHLARSYHSHLSPPERTDDPDEAGEGDSTIVPLLSEQSNRGRKPGRPRPTSRPSHSRTSSYQSSYHSEYDDTAEIVEQKLRPVERVVAYAIFFVLGACTLLAWNAEIVQGAYFKARLEGSAYEVSFSSWLTLTFTSCNLIFLGLSNYTQHGANYGRRIQWSNLTLLGVMILFIISTQLKEINPTLFFLGLIVSTIILAASASYLQGALVALSSHFGPDFLQQVISGQGAIGVAVAVIQFVAAFAAVKSSSTAGPDSAALRFQSGADDTYALFAPTPSPPSEIRTSAFHFFLAVGAFSGLGCLAIVVLSRFEVYKMVHARDVRVAKEEEPPSVFKVERKVRHLGLAVLLVFAVTLSVFPGVTSTILSAPEGRDPRWLQLPRTLEQPALFIPLVFGVFAAGDWIGRLLPQWQRLVFTNWKALMGASVARVVFIPLFLMCNIKSGQPGFVPVINKDATFLLIMLLFAISNGYLSTLILLAVVVDDSLEPEEIDVAATASVVYLTAGLAVGSLLSFPVGLVAKAL